MAAEIENKGEHPQHVVELVADQPARPAQQEIEPPQPGRGAVLVLPQPAAIERSGGDIHGGEIGFSGQAGKALRTGLGKGLGLALDLLLPASCLHCRVEIVDQVGLCGACWRHVGRLAPPWCETCGAPFAYAGLGERCARCVAFPPRFGRARAALAYDDVTRDLILGLKYADRTLSVPAFAAWMAAAGRPLLAQADLLVPVPLHPWRLWRRRFNQAALLARRLGRLADREVDPTLLIRRRATPSQGRLGREARRRNVAAAFAVSARRAARLKGRRILLVDDVLTSGATVDECAATLLREGVAAVDVLTLARVGQAG